MDEVKNCRKCTYWGNNNGRVDTGNYTKTCNSEKFIYIYPNETKSIDNDCVVIEINSTRGLLTGPDFGCVHWA
jgi:hypothetical protein